MRSFVIGLAGLGTVVLMRTLAVLGVDGVSGEVIVSDIGEVGIVFVAAVLVLIFGSLLTDPDSSRQWILLGTGALLFAAGDALWVITEMATAAIPYPGAPDLFYVAEYLFVTAAVVLAGRGLRHRVETRSAFLIAALTCVVGLGVLYFGVIRQLMLIDGLAVAQLRLSVFYSVADIVLLVTPAVFLLVLAVRTGDRCVIVPWAVVGISVMLLTITNATFSWMAAVGTYTSGAPVDYGWVGAHVGLALAASLAFDADTVPNRASEAVDSMQDTHLVSTTSVADAHAAIQRPTPTRRGV